MGRSEHEIASEILGVAIEKDHDAALKYIRKKCEGNESLLRTVLELYETIMEEDSHKPHTEQEFSKRLQVKDDQTRSQIIGSWTRVIFGNRRNRLIVLLLSLILLLVIGVLLEGRMRSNIVEYERQRMESHLRANYNTLQKWAMFNYRRIESLSKLPEIIQLTKKADSLVDATNGYDVLLEEDLNSELRGFFMKNSVFNYSSYASLLHKEDARVMLASGTRPNHLDTVFCGARLKGYVYDSYNRMIHDPKPTFIKPIFDYNVTFEFTEREDSGVAIVFLSPIFDHGTEDVLGYLGYSLNPEDDFSDILNIGEFGESGETYAFDEFGYMISKGRFAEDLKNTALLKHERRKSTIYTIQLREPGGDVMEGFEPDTPMESRPFTKAVQAAFKADNSEEAIVFGEIMKPYQDYRGIEVVGAWMWLPEYDLGIISEIDAEEAFQNLRYFHLIFGGLYFVVVVLSILLYHSNVRIALIGKKAEGFKKLGQYRLLNKLGEGGFGEVYKAEHMFLKTPVAIKILKREFIGTDMLDRFEKEVKTTSSLHHPNTVRVFDYGTSNQGQFYYVMEYLNGVSLDKIVQMGDVPASRGIHILLNVCYSLQEAHNRGLIHRDVKPANIMVCNQGGALDIVKLLDFGLVKNVDTSISQQTQINRIGGTPMFMAPERLRDPFNTDQKVDIYSIGAVGLYMFSGRYVVELISQQMLSGQETISGEIGQVLHTRKDVPTRLLGLLLDCIHFEPARRPAEMQLLIDDLESLAKEYPWGNKEAHDWWKKYDIYSVN